MQKLKNGLVLAFVIAGLMMPMVSDAQPVSIAPLALSPNTTVNPLPLLCYDFQSTLKRGSKGDAVRRLQFFLLDSGYNIDPSEYGIYGDNTFAAVKGFQEKYSGDILVPSQLSAGNGIVGRLTRKKLNWLYGCGAINQELSASGLNLQISATSLDGSGVSVTFCNKGARDIPTFPIRIRLNGINRDFDIIGARSAGACITNTFNYDTWGLSFDPGATFTAITIVDPLGVYKKAGVTFPTGSETKITVPVLNGLHLAVRSLLLKSTGVQATLCNLGNADVTKFPVKVTVNGNAQDLDVPQAYKKGVCAPVTFPYSTWGITFTPGTLYSASVLVDPNNIYSEVNEFDNSAAVVGTL
ncbi:MAG: hypothetical protein KW806_02520 [Candidatus Yanofskybacteria bacterium]|nr:hypothetical protein [Candidatus Yanofskybacteria bacterium]